MPPKEKKPPKQSTKKRKLTLESDDHEEDVFAVQDFEEDDDSKTLRVDASTRRHAARQNQHSTTEQERPEALDLENSGSSQDTLALAHKTQSHLIEELDKRRDRDLSNAMARLPESRGDDVISIATGGIKITKIQYSRELLEVCSSKSSDTLLRRNLLEFIHCVMMNGHEDFNVYLRTGDMPDPDQTPGKQAGGSFSQGHGQGKSTRETKTPAGKDKKSTVLAGVRGVGLKGSKSKDATRIAKRLLEESDASIIDVDEAPEQGTGSKAPVKNQLKEKDKPSVFLEGLTLRTLFLSVSKQLFAFSGITALEGHGSESERLFRSEFRKCLLRLDATWLKKLANGSWGVIKTASCNLKKGHASTEGLTKLIGTFTINIDPGKKDIQVDNNFSDWFSMLETKKIKVHERENEKSGSGFDAFESFHRREAQETRKHTFIRSVTLTQVAEEITTDNILWTLCFGQCKDWYKSFRRYMKGFVKEASIQFLNRYTPAEYYQKYKVKKVNNSRSYELVDDSIFIECDCMIDFKALQAEYESILVDNGFEPEKASPLVPEDLPTPVVDHTMNSQDSIDLGLGLNQAARDTDGLGVEKEIRTVATGRDMPRGKTAPFEFHGLSGLRMHAVKNYDVKKERGNAGVLHFMYTTGKCSFGFPKLFDPVPLEHSNNGEFLKFTPEEILVQASRLATWDNLIKLQDRVVGMIREFIIKYREWEDSNDLVKNEKGIYEPSKEALLSYKPSFF